MTFYGCFGFLFQEGKVADKDSAERRSYVREDLSFKVNFRAITPEEFKAVRGSNDKGLSTDKGLIVDIDDIENGFQKNSPNAGIIDVLLQIDEKLDRVLSLLADEDDKGALNQGIGVNISGSGMTIIVDKPVEEGQIIHTKFVLSRRPLVFLNAFGEIVQVTKMDDNGKTPYRLGVEFLDLNPMDRERIIACVFQRQRETIRQRKSEGRHDG